MNKIMRWFYARNDKRCRMEMEDKGLNVFDDEKYQKYLYKLTRKDILYNIAFIILIGLFILKWAGVLK